MKLPKTGFVRALLVLALTKSAVGLCSGIWALASDWTTFRTRLPIFLLYVLAFSLSAVFLTYAGRAKSSAQLFGLLFAFVASPYAGAALSVSAPTLGALADYVGIWRYVQVDAFLPLVAWLLAAEFPQRPMLGRSASVLRLGTLTSLAVGLTLFLANLLMLAVPALESGWFGVLARRRNPSAYWPLLFLLLITALIFLLWKAMGSLPEERRRLTIMLSSIAVGVGPMLVITILHNLVPAEREWLHAPGREWITFLLVDVFLLSVPITVGYSILVHRVFGLKYFLRTGAQYLLARYTVLTATALPLIALVLYLAMNRDQSVSSVLLGQPATVAMPLTLVGIIALRARTRLLRGLDRVFFRQTYDAQEILGSLVRRTRTISTAEELARVLAVEIQRALHVESVEVLLLDERERLFRSSRAEGVPLSTESSLVQLLLEEKDPLLVDLVGRDHKLERLSEQDQHWIADGGFAVVVPLVDDLGHLIGVTALGGKSSELPYTDSELYLLATVAAAAAGRLEHLRSKRPEGRNLSELTTLSPGDETVQSPSTMEVGQFAALALECTACRFLQEIQGVCSRCGGPTESVGVPLVINGKYQLEKRLGQGGMGVVFRARDLALDRDVAIKMLPRLSVGLASRLRREARAMASVIHPNLAMIHGAETCQGVPLLVIEYLREGTLSDHLANARRLEVGEVRRLGLELSAVLEVIHGVGILHRDIKPSNIGLTPSGSLKLLDFGLAKLLMQTSDELGQRRSESEGMDSVWSGDSLTQALVGTPSYMSPEALAERTPNYSFDIWSAGVVLYEALTGTHPFAAGSQERTVARIKAHSFRALDENAYQRSTQAMFEKMFSPERWRRPHNARQLGEVVTAGLSSGAEGDKAEDRSAVN